MVTRSNACGRDNHTLATELQGAALLPGARSAAIAMRAFADAGSDGWRRCRQPNPAGIRGRTKCWARAGGGCSRCARDLTADLADGLRRNHVPPAHSPWWPPLCDSRSRCRVERRVQVERHARASVDVRASSDERERERFERRTFAVCCPPGAGCLKVSLWLRLTPSLRRRPAFRFASPLFSLFAKLDAPCAWLWLLPSVAGPMRCLSPRPVSGAAGQS